MVGAIILSGGIGSRVHLKRPKQYVEVNSRPIIAFCINTLLSIHHIGVIVIGCSPEWRDYIETQLSDESKNKIFFSDAGLSRQHTTLNALRKLKELGMKEEGDIVLVQEAARPLTSQKLVETCIRECRKFDAVLPVVPIKEAAYLCSAEFTIESIPQRDKLFIGQVPEAFKFCKYLSANEKLSDEGLMKCHGGTEIAYSNGMSIKLVPGDEFNLKITTMKDMLYFKFLVENGYTGIM